MVKWLKKLNKIKEKKIKGENKFGVFNGNVINSETVGYDPEFTIEEYRDDSITITEVKEKDVKHKKIEINPSKIKKKANVWIFKVISYIVILLIIVGMITWLVIEKV
ncbi:hypothetical protein SAPIS_v1c08590 [Spiroplasma apis B31]|uniref:Transmembrane protein n=1 Tax=Spiroplasma apis B31 TaxID=1276258 RepID=V5RJG7_SPIAP|nr:hypothetical protein SAPIS_v1c08590 [Spiroplasma apis B31]